MFKILCKNIILCTIQEIILSGGEIFIWLYLHYLSKKQVDVIVSD